MARSTFEAEVVEVGLTQAQADYVWWDEVVERGPDFEAQFCGQIGEAGEGGEGHRILGASQSHRGFELVG